MSNCEFVTFPLVSWVKCGSWLYQFLIFALFRTWKDGNLLVYSRKFTNNHVKISKKAVKNICILYDTFVHVRTLFGCKIVIYLLPNNLNMCFGFSKEPSHWDVFFSELPKHRFWLRNTKDKSVMRCYLELWISTLSVFFFITFPDNTCQCASGWKWSQAGRRCVMDCNCPAGTIM